MISEEIQMIIGRVACGLTTYRDAQKLRAYLEEQEHTISGLTQSLATTNQQLFELIEEKQTWPVKT